MFSKTIFSEQPIFIYFFADLIQKNYWYIKTYNTKNITDKNKPKILFNSKSQTQIQQERINQIKKDNITYYKTKYNSEWIKQYKINQIVLNELKKNNINIKY